MVELKAHKESGEKGSETGKFNADGLGAKLAKEVYAGKLDFGPGTNNSAEKHLPQLNLVDDKHSGVDNQGKVIEPGDMNQNPDRLDPNKNLEAAIGKFGTQIDSNKKLETGMGKLADQLAAIKDVGSQVGKAGEHFEQDNKFNPELIRKVMEQNNPFQPIKEFKKPESEPIPLNNTGWDSARKALDPKYMNNQGF